MSSVPGVTHEDGLVGDAGEQLVHEGEGHGPSAHHQVVTRQGHCARGHTGGLWGHTGGLWALLDRDIVGPRPMKQAWRKYLNICKLKTEP